VDNSHRVVIVGGGFGGLYTAQALRKAPVQVTLLDRRNFHLFQPLLYQVATGALSPANIAGPLRSILRRQKNCQVLLGEVVGFDLDARRVHLKDGASVPYDSLIVASGSRHHYFGHPEWEKTAPGLKTIEDATTIRARVLRAFEAAERSTSPEKQRGLLTFVVVGGGPTGVELAGALADVAFYSLRHDFRLIDPRNARVLLLEAGDRILSTFPPELSAKAVQALHKLGVSVRTGAAVTDVQPEQVTIQSGDRSETIPTHTILWAAGVQASRLGRALAEASGASTDRNGRVLVQPDLSLPGRPEVFVIGDLANYSHQGGKPLPGLAPVAMQEGRYVADLIARRLRGRPPVPFHYKDRGNLATIGRSKAVADLGWVWFSGWLAWVTWLFVHLMYIVEFENRLLVLIQWAWNYVTRNRSARLITGPQEPQPLPGNVREDDVGPRAGPHVMANAVTLASGEDRD
jgi:NADH:ubiquinone reductase (H+-translocating)